MRYLEEFIRHFRDSWIIQAVFTLSDKDWSEIGAFQQVYPDAKYQLCFWHALRAIKKRLAILRRQPAFYNVENANTEYNWIRRDFVPVNQRHDQVSK